MAQTGTQEFLSEHQEIFLYCTVDWALAQVAQRGGRVSIPGDIQKPSGRGPGKLALDDPGWKGGLDKIISRVPFNLIHMMIL